MATVHHSLRQLRAVLGIHQRQLAVLVDRSRHTIESLEIGRLKLSPQLAIEISRACGVDVSWLLANDPRLPMVNRAGVPYTRRDFEIAQDKDLGPLHLYHLSPEMKVGNAYDLLFRALRAARRRNAVPQFITRLERFVRKEVGRFIELKDEVDLEVAKRFKAQRKVRDFLFPPGVEPLKRGRRRLAEAIAELSAWEKTIKK